MPAPGCYPCGDPAHFLHHIVALVYDTLRKKQDPHMDAFLLNRAHLQFGEATKRLYDPS